MLTLEEEPFAWALKSLRDVPEACMREVEQRLALLAGSERRIWIVEEGDYHCIWYEPGAPSDASPLAVAHIWTEHTWEPSFRMLDLHVGWEGDLAAAFISIGRLTCLRDDRGLQPECPQLIGNERLVGNDSAEQARVLAEYEWASSRAAQAQQALREMNPIMARTAARGGEGFAWAAYMGMGLVAEYEWARARDRPGNAPLWNYTSE